MSERRRAIPCRHASVASPCVRNCCLNEQDICLGCYRSLEEITAWGSASNAQRQAILQHANRRRQQIERNPPAT